MNKKGFTLIELLAVIVILAIIALIATPIVLNIINDTRESSYLRSAEFYLDALEQSMLRSEIKNKRVTDGVYIIDNKGKLCLSTDETKCIEVDIDGEKPTGGVITISDGQIINASLDLNNNVIIKKDNGEVIYSPCTLVSGEENEIGSKYECEVKPGTKHNFFVLSYNHKSGETNQTKENVETTNLIMERNICIDGSYATSENKCAIAWYALAGDNSYGPVTAMNYLYSATSTWSNIPNIFMNYTDEGNTGDYGYGGIKTEGNITKITKKDLTEVTVLEDKPGYTNLKVRMPYWKELSNYDSTNEHLYYHLDDVCGIKINSVSGVDGYWTLSTYAYYSSSASSLGCSSLVDDNSTNYNTGFGVRPVITVYIN